MKPSFTRASALRVIAASLIAAALGASAGAARAEDGVKLFKVITAKDEIVVGFTASALAAMTGASDLEKIGSKLRAAGQIEVWQYAAGKAASGDLEQAPAKRVLIFTADTLRLEPYATPLKVIPPA